MICPVIHLFLGLFNLSVVDFSAFRSLLCRVKDLPLLVCSFYTRRFMFWLQKKKLNIIKKIELCKTCIVVFKNKKMAGVRESSPYLLLSYFVTYIQNCFSNVLRSELWIKLTWLLLCLCLIVTYMYIASFVLIKIEDHLSGGKI